MVNTHLKHSNDTRDGSRYAADFDYLMHEFCVEKFAPLLSKKSILELGCYHGHMTKLLADIGSSVCALDIDPQCINVTKESLKAYRNVTFINSSFDDFEMPAGVDVLYFSHALEHTRDPLATLKHLRAQMAEQKLIIVVPNGNSLSRRIAEKMGLLPDRLCVTDFEREIGHHITFDADMLSDMVKEAGFSISQSGGIFPKIFSNGQLDASMSAGIIDHRFLTGLNALSDEFSDLCASIYVVVE